MPQGKPGWNCHWVLPDSYGAEPVVSAQRQVERWTGALGVKVYAGLPKSIFVVTNASGEIYEGRLELFDPPDPVSQGK
jgi:hypothetical protein